MLWTTVTLLVFIVCSRSPLCLITFLESANLLYWLHAILAFNQVALMELRTSLIVAFEIIVQYLTGAILLDVD